MRDRPMLERALSHPSARVQLYVAELIYAGERASAQWRFDREQDAWANEGQALPETDDFETLDEEL